MSRNYARKRNSTFFFDYDLDKVRAKYRLESDPEPEEGAEDLRPVWKDEGPNHPGVVFGAFKHKHVVRLAQLAGDTFEGVEGVAAPCSVIKRLVGDWSVLEDDEDDVPRFDSRPEWPAPTKDGLVARRDVLLALDAVDGFALANRANAGLYLTEDERGN